MTDLKQSLLSLTSVGGGIAIQSSVRAFGESSSDAVSRICGFDLREGTSGDVAYPVVTLTGETRSDAPDLVVSLRYDQTESFDEVDLNLKWQGMPAGTSAELESSFEGFRVQRMTLDGSSGSTGRLVKTRQPIQATMTLRLWLREPGGFKPDASFTVNTATPIPKGYTGPAVERIASLGGPIRMRLLGQVVLNPGGDQR
jgi:hypothetical protein